MRRSQIYFLATALLWLLGGIIFQNAETWQAKTIAIVMLFAGASCLAHAFSCWRENE